MEKRLTRSTKDAMLAGVAAGIAEYFDIDPTLIRLGFVLITLLGGSGILAYIILWLIIPSDNSKGTDIETTIENNAKEISLKAKTAATKAGKSVHREQNRLLWAIVLIGLGFYFLLHNFGLLDWLNIREFWPVLLIIFGLVLLGKK